MQQKKVVIVLDKERSEELLEIRKKQLKALGFSGDEFDSIFDEIKKQYEEISKPEEKQIARLGSMEFNVIKEYCPKCGHQIYPKIEEVRCKDCGWRGSDNDIVYKPVEKGSDDYMNHCPECDGTNIKRLKKDESKQE